MPVVALLAAAWLVVVAGVVVLCRMAQRGDAPAPAEVVPLVQRRAARRYAVGERR
ncbi:MAG TPA: hypothetical protein VFV85_03945 [Conexibacter sp.]|nr:hypothetical protein [Conexibacter sp.]